MQADCQCILGKTIESVVIKQCDSGLNQLYLVFDDGTHFEFYSRDDISPTKGLWTGGLEEVRKYMADTCSIVLEDVE